MYCYTGKSCIGADLRDFYTDYKESPEILPADIMGEMEFIDAVHERPVNIAGPTKDFVSYAHHYGYVYKNEEEKRAHIKRNTDLLLEQIKREPGCVRHYCHLTQEYNVIKEYEKSLEYALEGIKNADMKISENNKDLPGLYGNVIWVMVNQLRYEDVINYSEMHLKSEYMT